MFLFGLTPSCEKLTWLSLDSIASVNEQVVVDLAAHCPGLTFLDLSFCREIKQLAILPSALQRLVKLRELRAYGLDLTPPVLAEFKRSMPLLRIIFIPNRT